MGAPVSTQMLATVRVAQRHGVQCHKARDMLAPMRLNFLSVDPISMPKTKNNMAGSVKLVM